MLNSVTLLLSIYQQLCRPVSQTSLPVIVGAASRKNGSVMEKTTVLMALMSKIVRPLPSGVKSQTFSVTVEIVSIRAGCVTVKKIAVMVLMKKHAVSLILYIIGTACKIDDRNLQ